MADAGQPGAGKIERQSTTEDGFDYFVATLDATERMHSQSSRTLQPDMGPTSLWVSGTGTERLSKRPTICGHNLELESLATQMRAAARSCSLGCDTVSSLSPPQARKQIDRRET